MKRTLLLTGAAALAASGAAHAALDLTGVDVADRTVVANSEGVFSVYTVGFTGTNFAAIDFLFSGVNQETDGGAETAYLNNINAWELNLGTPDPTDVILVGTYGTAYNNLSADQQAVDSVILLGGTDVLHLNIPDESAGLDGIIGPAGFIGGSSGNLFQIAVPIGTTATYDTTLVDGTGGLFDVDGDLHGYSLLGDINLDGIVDTLDIQPFVDLLAGGGFQFEADVTGNGVVDTLDIQPFVDIVSGASVVAANAVPEPGSLALIGLGGLALLRRRRK